jgi:catechol 2,3-dioxygenase-like lactoylglutathione lyase family enzyme
MATTHFANVDVDWVQPIGTDNLIADFLKETGGGVFGLLYNVPDEAALKAEEARMKALGVNPLLEGEIFGAPAYVVFDTRAQGKYYVGLFTNSGERAAAAGAPKVTQYALIARQPEGVSAYWEKLGWPAFTYSVPDTSDLVYRGKPGAYTMRLGWQRHGSVPFEWIQPGKGPSGYEEHLKRHGEGFHHLALNVEDMDAAIKEWQGRGFALSMGGAWGEKGKPGSGRFAYFDMYDCCRMDVELLWNYHAR